MKITSLWKIVRACILALGTAAVTLADEPASVSLPEIPYPKSDWVHGIRWLGDPIHDFANVGDVWSTTWAGDNNLYTVSDDNGWGYNLSISKIEGMPPHHKVTLVNKMEDYGKTPEQHWWKGAGLVDIDGVLYLGIYSQSNPSNLSASRVSYNADNSSIIKSTDYGQTWSGSAANSWDKPMFPRKEFPTPFFVQYGKGYAGAIDDYVYVCSNDGGWNNWNRMMLARVPRAKFGALDRRDWEFFVSADHQNTPTWTTDVSKAGSIFENKLHTSMTGIQYVPALGRFILAQWSYVAMNAKGPCLESYFLENSPLPFPWKDDVAHKIMDQTMLCVFESPKPWGPWKLAHTQAPWGPAFYNPSFPSKWFDADGKKGWIIESGNFRDQSKGGYEFITRQMEWY
jgi:hypothetical protein